MVEKELELEKIERLEQEQQYIAAMRPVFNRRALFTDTTEEYISPAEPEPFDTLKVRFRTARNNIDRVSLVSGNKSYIMSKEDSEDKHFDFYNIELPLEDTKISYHFEIQTGRLKGFYDTRGVVEAVNEYYDFVVIPGFHTPEWAKGAVMYQIYVDRFCNGDTSNDVQTAEYCYIGEPVQKVEDWNRYPAQMDVRDFYGGDLQGVLDKMDYLQELGVEVIYFNPLFVSPSNHKYDIQDYDYIDPHFGKIVEEEGEILPPGQKENRFATKYVNRVTNYANLEASNELFIRVVEEAHRRGMHVIIDGVFNHCGSFNKWLDRERIYENAKGYEKGAYVSQDSPYRSYFDFHDSNRWPYNPSYDGWWGHDTLPKLNYEGSKELMDYMMRIGKKWVSPPFCADGWRLDVAADLGHSEEFNHQFWRKFRKAVKEANPNAIILAEHYGDANAWLRGDQWDTVMNYDGFMDPVSWFLTGVDKHSDNSNPSMLGNAEAFNHTIKYFLSRLQTESSLVAMNELSNHDHSRFLTRTNKMVGRVATSGTKAAQENINEAIFKQGVIMQMTLPGAPTLYYGDEAGVCGWTDPDNRRTYPWGKENLEIMEFYREAIALHRHNKVLKTGSYKPLASNQDLVCYGRFDDKDAVVTAINTSNSDMEINIPVLILGKEDDTVWERLIETSREFYNCGRIKTAQEDGHIHIRVPGQSAVVYRSI